MKRLLISLGCILVIGGIGAGLLVRSILAEHAARNQAIKDQVRQDVSVTIIEGKRQEEIAAQLEKAGICSRADFLAASQGKEGYLFPDTYRFFPDTPAKDVVDRMLADFQTKIGQLAPSKDQIILASIIEREAQNDSERATIAGVYANRLRLGMKLEADPTVQYGKDTAAYADTAAPLAFAFWSPITQADYASALSPYNTYLHEGLPPGPIANPGKQSILAAIDPAQHDYLYFLHKDKQLLLSKTLAEQLSKE